MLRGGDLTAEFQVNRHTGDMFIQLLLLLLCEVVWDLFVA